MGLWRLYYHLVWTTKERQPLITSDIEPYLYGYILGKAQEQETILHAIGGIEDHIHLIVSIPPKLAIASFVKRIKGSSAHYINNDIAKPFPEFNWQRSYGVFSLGNKQLDNAVSYVLNQKTHHREGSLISTLEQDFETDSSPPIWRQGEAIVNINVIRPLARYES